MNYNESLLRTVELVVAQASRKTTNVGTVVSVQTTNMRAMVIFDGATVATPVKVSGHVQPRANDRVGLTHYGTEWYVTDVLNRIIGPPGGGVSQNAPTGTKADSTPANYPGNPVFTFVKRWDTTPTLMFGALSGFNTVAVNSMACAIGLTGSGGTQTVYTLWSIEGGGANARFGYGNCRVIPDPTTTDPILADTYTANLMWYRSVGAGTLNTTNNQDWGSGFAVELGVWT